LRWRLRSRQGYFHFQTVGRAAQGDSARLMRTMAMEAEPASGHHGGLKLQDGFVFQPSSIGKVPRCSAHRRDQPVVRIETHYNLMASISHNYWSLASATSHASRHSGQ